MQIGDKVFLEPTGNRARYDYQDKSIQEYEIKKIGRKYLEVWKDKREFSTEKFYLENFRQVTNYSAEWNLYFSEQEILDKKEKQKIERELYELFKYNSSGFSIDKLRRIKSIIDEK